MWGLLKHYSILMQMPIFKRYVTRLIVKNGHQADTYRDCKVGTQITHASQLRFGHEVKFFMIHNCLMDEIICDPLQRPICM